MAIGVQATLLISCEHGGNRIPARYGELFAGHEPLLASHRGYDPGALALARELAAALGAALFYTTTSRLLVELNRSPGHPQLFSPMVRALPRAERRRLIERFYRPYRDSLEARVAGEIGRGRRVLHLSCHSFTPVLDGVARRADVGLLFDPSRAWEAAFCAGWQRRLREADPALRVRRNYPYRGTADSFVKWLRRRFDAASYAGVELEVNQRFPLEHPAAWHALRVRLLETLSAALASRSVGVQGESAARAPVPRGHAAALTAQ